MQILVTGDTTVDWSIARKRPLQITPGYQYVWGSDISTSAHSNPGGAALLKMLAAAICDRGAEVAGPDLPDEAFLNPGFSGCVRSYSEWQPYPRSNGDRKPVWRISDFWGTAPATNLHIKGRSRQQAADVIIVDDSALGFRDQPDQWPTQLRDASTARLIVHKLAGTLSNNQLLEHLLLSAGDRLLIIVPVADLRKANLHIGYALSWEQLATDVHRAIMDHPQLSRAHVVIAPVGVTGAVVVGSSAAHLVFDSHHHEEDWKRAHPGSIFGYTSCFATAVLHAFIQDPAKPDWVAAAQQGAHAARTLHVSGYGNADSDLSFPIDVVTAALRVRDLPISTVQLDQERPDWTILAGRKIELMEIAKAVACCGADRALSNVPIERIGSWASVDRDEIESVRSLRNLIAEYATQTRPGRPLSLAVFGPPGSGKSFAIKEIARALMPGRITALEFNLSQFDSARELPFAFHRIRDCVLRGQLPLVFWDEFDTPLDARELGWLRYFLAPMQDGEFREAGVNQPLGAAVFVFAGGTYADLASFRKTAEASAAAKGRDFLSRLRGFLDVRGPNPQGQNEKAFVLRRALLLRSLVERKAAHLIHEAELQIDNGVLHALLAISQYHHGARSMESVLDMSSVSDKLMFERSSLPPLHQLALHVDADEFMRLVTRGHGE